MIAEGSILYSGSRLVCGNQYSYYFLFLERYKELQMLLNEFKMPIVRIERDLEILVDGLEGKSRCSSYKIRNLQLILWLEYVMSNKFPNEKRYSIGYRKLHIQNIIELQKKIGRKELVSGFSRAIDSTNGSLQVPRVFCGYVVIVRYILRKSLWYLISNPILSLAGAGKTTLT